MSIERVAELQREFAHALAARATRDWSVIEARGTYVAGVGEAQALATSPTSRESVNIGKAIIAVRQLQDAMYQPGLGTWFSFTCTIDSDGAYHYTFNYDEHVPFPDGREPLRDSWIKELRRHPRPWHLIPEWHPVKQDFTEQEWADDIAAYEASDDYRDPTGKRSLQP